MLFWYIVVNSFLGFLLEVAYSRLIWHSDRVRKCRLLLPVCPVYGVGAALILSCPVVLRRSIWTWMLGGMVAATVAEYAAAWFYEQVWRVSFWDYSDQPGNLHGRVCLPFSLLWGVLTLPLVQWVQPVEARLVAAVPRWMLLPMLTLWAADFVLTGLLLHRTGKIESLRWWTPQGE